MKKIAAFVIGTSLSLFAPLSQADFFSFQIGYSNPGYYPSPYYYPYQPYGYYSYYVPPPYYYRPYPSYYIGYYSNRPYYGYRHNHGKGNYYHRKYRQGNRPGHYGYRRWIFPEPGTRECNYRLPTAGHYSVRRCNEYTSIIAGNPSKPAYRKK